MTEQLILVCDTETGGVTNNPATGAPDVIELAWQKLTDYWFKILTYPNFVDYTVEDVLNPKGPIEEGSKFNQRYKPSIPIHKQAIATHGITYDMVKDCPSHYEAKLPEGVTYLAGHNVAFDHRCLGKPDVKLICTQRLAKKYKKAFNIPFENVQLDYLVTYFYPDRPELIKRHHTALNDCCKTILLLAALMKYTPKIDSFDKLYEIQEML